MKLLIDLAGGKVTTSGCLSLSIYLRPPAQASSTPSKSVSEMASSQTTRAPRQAYGSSGQGCLRSSPLRSSVFTATSLRPSIASAARSSLSAIHIAGRYLITTMARDRGKLGCGNFRARTRRYSTSHWKNIFNCRMRFIQNLSTYRLTILSSLVAPTTLLPTSSACSEMSLVGGKPCLSEIETQTEATTRTRS